MLEVFSRRELKIKEEFKSNMEAEIIKTVLTVDDDEFVREILAAYLEDSGYEVLQAENGLLGLETFRRKKPDLVMLDLRMPEMDGLEVLGYIIKESPDTPVILVSGMGTIGDAIKALKLGAWDYIAKPIHDMGVLEHAVNKALERAEFLEQRKKYRAHLEEEVKKRTAEVEQRRLELEKAYNDLQVEVEVHNQGRVGIDSVLIQLTTTGNSQVQQNQLVINFIEYDSNGLVTFDIEADSNFQENAVYEIFNAQILSAKDSETGKQVPIDNSRNSIAIVKIQIIVNVKGHP